MPRLEKRETLEVHENQGSQREVREMIRNGTLGSMPDYSGIAFPRPTKSKNGGLGGGRKKNENKLKPMSKKHRKRTNGLQDKLEVILQVHDRIYHQRICEASMGHKNWNHKCPSLDGRYYELFADHVETRNMKDADKYENLQALCSWCNRIKGSIRGLDFRCDDMKKEMRKLDNDEKRKEV